VPARLAGRRLPSGTKPAGTSWEPVGIVVATAGGGELGALDPATVSDAGWLVGGAVVGGLVGAVKDNILGGALTGLVVGGVGMYLRRRQFS
jgi:hypothetical protein